MNIARITGADMKYDDFEAIFNKAIFEKSKPDLIRKIAIYPERYAGLFRPTKPRGKIIQNLLQSHEIRFGDAFELLIEKYLEEAGFSILGKKFDIAGGDYVELDHVFSKGAKLYFIEQKVRDDHDSTKKRGQIDNFEKKLEVILQSSDELEVVGFFYFIDDSFDKNKNFYTNQIEALSNDYGTTLHLTYGARLFDLLEECDIWSELLTHLERWKNSIPDFPEINFDKDPTASFDEIKQLKPIEYRKLFSNPDLDDFLCVLFPERATLRLLRIHFASKHGDGKIYETLRVLCDETITRLENRQVAGSSVG